MTRITILKGLAICSSIVLAGGFVAYRQKQAASPENGEVEMMPSSKSRQVVFPSSKNIDAVLSNPNPADSSGTQTIPADTEEREKVFLPSSKRIEMPVFRSRTRPAGDPSKLPEEKTGEDFIDPLPEKEKPAESGKDRTLLPSSKIGAILTPEDTRTKAPQEEKKATAPEAEP